MLTEIFTWWTRQMLDLLPNRLGRQDAPGRDALVIRVQDGASPMADLSAAFRQRGIETELGRFTIDAPGIARLRAACGSRRPAAVVLEVPRGLLLEREVQLPLAASGDIERVLGYEMDRITPFAAAELFWTWRLEHRDRTLGRLLIRLSVVHRPMIDAALEALRRAGFAPGLLSAVAPDGTLRSIPLSRATAPSATQRMAVRSAGAVCALLAVAVLAAPLLLNARAIAAADARIDALRPRVAQVEALRRRLAADTSGADVFAADAARVGSALQALAALTETLPDDTSLSSLSLRQRALTFTGQSARAARLIAALSADPIWRDPAFVTPVTRAASGGYDLFSIRAGLGL